MDKLVSIIVPIYNIEENIRFCIESILEQTYKELDIVLVDDGSTDGCGDICDEYAEKDSRIRVIHQKNRGLSGARNVGINAALGSMIMFVDGDDIIHNRMVEILEMDLNSVTDCLYSSCWFQKISKYEMRSISISSVKNMSTRETAINLLSGAYENISAWGKLYKTSNIGSLRFSEGRIHYEDKAFLFQLLLNNPDMSIAERQSEMYGYYVRANSITNSKFSVRTLDILYHSKLILDLTCTEMPEFKYLGEKSDAISHLMVLKCIIQSGDYYKYKEIFNQVKKQLLEKYGDMSRHILGRYRNELDALIIGNWIYIVCVLIVDQRKRIVRFIKKHR